MASWFSWQFGNRALSVFILHVGAKSTVDCCVLLECTRGVTEIAFFCCMCKNGLNFTNDWVCRCSGRLQNHCEKISRGTRVKKAPSLHRYTLVHPNITHIVSESWNKRENLSPFQIFYFFLSCFSWYPQQCKHIRAVDSSLLWVSLWVFIYCL